jgi:hypothetical protein
MVPQDERTILKEVIQCLQHFAASFLVFKKSIIFFLLLSACRCKLLWSYHQQQRMFFFKLSSFFLIKHYRQLHSSFFLQSPSKKFRSPFAFLFFGVPLHVYYFKAWWVCTGYESVMLAKPQILNLRFGALLWCGILKGQVCIDICKQFVWGSPHAIVLHECFMFLCTKEPFSLNSLMTPLPPGILEWFITQSCFKWQRMSALPRELCPKQEPL